MSNIITITVDNFDAEVLKADMPVLVDFWAPWCGPCRAVAPMLETINQELQGKIKIGKVNVDDHQQLAVRFGVQAIPTLIVFKNGEAVDHIVGMISREQISSHLQALMVNVN